MLSVLIVQVSASGYIMCIDSINEKEYIICIDSTSRCILIQIIGIDSTSQSIRIHY